MSDYRNIRAQIKTECFITIVVFEFINTYENVGIFLSPQIYTITSLL